MSTSTINVAQDFSKYPGGRYLTDGEFSGERFRHEMLAPALRQHEAVTVELDGTLGYGSGFLEEAFGGLVREAGMDKARLGESLKLETGNETLRCTILTYIREAKK
jgi:hypothetical protein